MGLDVFSMFDFVCLFFWLFVIVLVFVGVIWVFVWFF